ncbi:hypothetical protein SLEP1_g52050 [Rubroshorea leprosula]|uniref:Uncharacterized protein n=1 Tax=Rubroshorea leprosula TaxID=152421 RepID=A0AAV5M540_9ROSI|nr:hypothetical protein SLEP1_g52050 [Rubroshorea leprosula]
MLTNKCFLLFFPEQRQHSSAFSREGIAGAYHSIGQF